MIGGLCPKIQSILITTVCVPTYSLYTTRRSVSQHTVYTHHDGLCPNIQSIYNTTVCVPPYSLHTSRRSVSHHTVYTHHDGLCPNIQSIYIKTFCFIWKVSLYQMTECKRTSDLHEPWSNTPIHTKRHQQMHTSIVKLVYEQNRLLRVPADHAATRRMVRYKGWNSPPWGWSHEWPKHVAGILCL